MDTPPISAVGDLCQRSFLGITIKPFLWATFITIGVNNRLNIKEIIPVMMVDQYMDMSELLY